jgi:hypothetical protein
MDLSSRGQKDLFVEKRRERLHGGMQGDQETGGPRGQVGHWVFVTFFILPEGRNVSQVQTDISWEREVSPWPIITFWDLLQSALHTQDSFISGRWMCKVKEKKNQREEKVIHN